MKKIYIKYSRPFNSETDTPPILELWINGDRPNSIDNDFYCPIFVYDIENDHVLEERLWDGIE